MASTVFRRFFHALVASVICAGSVAPIGAYAIGLDTELLELRKGLREVTAGLSEGGSLRQKSVAEILESHFTLITQPAPYSTPIFREPNAPAKLGWTDMRIGLAMLSQTYGGKDNGDIQTARTDGDTHAIAVEAGVATLKQLRQQLTHREIAYNSSTNTYRLRVPIVIKDGSALRLGPTDILELSRSEGAYILNFGHLQVFGSTIRATATPNPEIEEFVPFVTSVGTGSAHITGAHISDLGFGSTEKFSGVSVIAYPPMRATRPSRIENNRFDRLATVMVIGQSGTTISNNRFFDMRRNPLMVSRSAHVEITQNLFSGTAPTNAIRVLDGSDHARVIGNLLLNGSRAGVLVAGGSDHVIIRDNLIWKRDGGGVNINGSKCGYVVNNMILDDRQKGIELRNSPNAHVHDNFISGNTNAAIWISGQPKGSTTYLTSNVMKGNGSGISAASAGDIALFDNDLTNQFPRLLDGDITLQFRNIIKDLEGNSPILLNAGGAWPAHVLEPRTCAG